MPLFDYRCDRCDTKEEVLVFKDKDENVYCESCGEEMKLLPSVFKTRKGGGLYSFDEPKSQTLGDFEED